MRQQRGDPRDSSAESLVLTKGVGSARRGPYTWQSPLGGSTLVTHCRLGATTVT